MSEQNAIQTVDLFFELLNLAFGRWIKNYRENEEIGKVQAQIDVQVGYLKATAYKDSPIEFILNDVAKQILNGDQINLDYIKAVIGKSDLQDDEAIIAKVFFERVVDKNLSVADFCDLLEEVRDNPGRFVFNHITSEEHLADTYGADFALLIERNLIPKEHLEVLFIISKEDQQVYIKDIINRYKEIGESPDALANFSSLRLADLNSFGFKFDDKIKPDFSTSAFIDQMHTEFGETLKKFKASKGLTDATFEVYKNSKLAKFKTKTLILGKANKELRNYFNAENPIGSFKAKYSNWFINAVAEKDLTTGEILTQDQQRDQRGAFIDQLSDSYDDYMKTGNLKRGLACFFHVYGDENSPFAYHSDEILAQVATANTGILKNFRHGILKNSYTNKSVDVKSDEYALENERHKMEQSLYDRNIFSEQSQKVTEQTKILFNEIDKRIVQEAKHSGNIDHLKGMNLAEFLIETGSPDGSLAFNSDEGRHEFVSAINAVNKDMYAIGLGEIMLGADVINKDGTKEWVRPWDAICSGIQGTAEAMYHASKANPIFLQRMWDINSERAKTNHPEIAELFNAERDYATYWYITDKMSVESATAWLDKKTGFQGPLRDMVEGAILNKLSQADADLDYSGYDVVLQHQCEIYRYSTSASDVSKMDSLVSRFATLKINYEQAQDMSLGRE
jgi:hypothetical protein